uniref:Immunoglobulin domain-containing protein n=1 Tax=Cyprinus carpio TaxID=7962 RepID=A0A8C1PDS8_CYPCA
MIQTCVVDFYTSSHWLLVSQQKVTFLFPRILDLFSKTWRKMLGVFLTLCVLLFHGASGVEMDKVSVMEGDSVTLNTDVTKNKQDRIMWYFNENRIAYITGDQTKICTDPECPETFRGRLKLDTQTGSLTITNTRSTDSGVYHLQINSRNLEKIFNVTVHDAPAAGRDEMKSVQEGESVTLDPGAINNPNDLMTRLFNDTCIAEISGDQSKICTDVHCEDGSERFGDRVEVNQTEFLTVTNIRSTDSGVYHLQINSSSSSFSYCHWCHAVIQCKLNKVPFTEDCFN